ncbi:MAG: enoyl-CoA hydratase/isomerase family protein [Dehalococcoidia bacterium]|nr:enoyl-CoA hydratase/isomerase family protein [Dehalococcoidia bacterium]
MTYETLLYARDKGVGLVTLSRPKALNALSSQLLAELDNLLTAVESDEETRVLVITGARRPDNRPCFSAGADLKEIAEKGPLTLKRKGMVAAVEAMATLDPVENQVQSLCDRVESFGKPVIAAIDGVCTAGGLELALSCDILIAAETAQISDLHIKNLGVLGGAGVTTRLARAVGPAKAKEIVFTGDPIDGREAWRIGLVNRVVPQAQLLPEATALGQKLATMRADALRLAKASINATMDMDFRQALRYSYLCWTALGDTSAGAKAFAERSGKGPSR